MGAYLVCAMGLLNLEITPLLFVGLPGLASLESEGDLSYVAVEHVELRGDGVFGTLGGPGGSITTVTTDVLSARRLLLIHLK